MTIEVDGEADGRQPEVVDSIWSPAACRALAISLAGHAVMVAAFVFLLPWTPVIEAPPEPPPLQLRFQVVPTVSAEAPPAPAEPVPSVPQAPVATPEPPAKVEPPLAVEPPALQPPQPSPPLPQPPSPPIPQPEPALREPTPLPAPVPVAPRPAEVMPPPKPRLPPPRPVVKPGPPPQQPQPIRPIVVPPPTGSAATAEPRPAPPEATLSRQSEQRPPAATADNDSATRAYGVALRAWIESHKRYPDEARAFGDEGRATVRFTIDRTGKVLAYTILKGTGSPRLDHAIEAMLDGADTLPRFPPEMTLSQVQVTMILTYALH